MSVYRNHYFSFHGPNFLLSLLFLIMGLGSPAQSWKWGKQGVGNSDTWGVGTDAEGHGYLTGAFVDSIRFGNTLLNSISNGDVYFVKYDSLGNLLWAKQSLSLNANASAWGSVVAGDKLGNSIFTGYITDSVKIGNTILYSPVVPSVFVAKFDPNGNVLWATQSVPWNSTSNGFANSYAICTDQANNIYVTGTFGDSLYFGTYSLTTANNVSDVFLTKYDPSGNVIWTRQSQSATFTSSGSGQAVCTDLSGHVFVGGNFGDTLSFGTFNLRSRSVSGDAFLAKYDSSGNVLWAKQSTSVLSSGALVNAVTADRFGAAYITGSLGDSVSFGSFSFSHLPVSPNILVDAFLIKYSPAGNVIWAKAGQFDSLTRILGGYGLSSDSLGHVYLSAGIYKGDTTHNSRVIFLGDTFSCAPHTDPSLLFKLDTAGKVLCKTFVPTGGDDNNGIASSLSGKYVYFGGDFFLGVRFNADSLIVPRTAEYPFIARWSPCPDITLDGIIESHTNEEVRIYPNPASDHLTIEWTDPSEGDVKLTLNNLLGEKIRHESIRTSGLHRTQLDVSSLPSGLYFLNMAKLSGSTLSFKVLISR